MGEVNHETCNCHECTRIRWKSSLQGQIESAVAPQLMGNWSCAACGRAIKQRDGKLIPCECVAAAPREAGTSPPSCTVCGTGMQRSFVCPECGSTPLDIPLRVSPPVRAEAPQCECEPPKAENEEYVCPVHSAAQPGAAEQGRDVEKELLKMFGELIDEAARTLPREEFLRRADEASRCLNRGIMRGLTSFAAGKFRSELRLACPSVRTNDAEWIIAYFTSTIEEYASRTAALEQQVAAANAEKELEHVRAEAWYESATTYDRLRKEVESSLAAKDAEIAQLKEAMQNLLAVIHRDGGHYTADHGLVKSATDAEKIVTDLRSQLKEELEKR